MQADLLAAVLEAQGVRVEVFGDTGYGVGIDFTDARLMVPDGEAAAARRLIKEADEAPVEREEKTKSGIVLPDTAKEKPQEGIVEAVGTGRILDNGTKIPMELKVGDKILYAKYAGNEFKLDEIEYLIVSEKDVLAVVSSNGKSKK